MTAESLKNQLNRKIGQVCSAAEETVLHEAGVQAASEADGGGQGGTKQARVYSFMCYLQYFSVVPDIR